MNWQNYFDNFTDFVIAMPAIYSKPSEAAAQNRAAVEACVKQVQKYLVKLGFDSHGVTVNATLDGPTRASLTFMLGQNWPAMTWLAIAQHANDQVKMGADFAGRDLTKATHCMRGWRREGNLCVKTDDYVSQASRFLVPAAIVGGIYLVYNGWRNAR
jgi:hypothetical protein